MSPTTQALCILVLPLVGFVIQIFLGKRLPRQGDFIPTSMIFLACLFAWNLFGSEVLPYDQGIDIREVTLITKDPHHHSGHKIRGRLVKVTKEGFTLTPRGGHGSEFFVKRSDILGDHDGDGIDDGLPRYSFKREFRWGGKNWMTVGREPRVGEKSEVAPALDFSFNFLIDNLTAIMLVVVTTVSFLVHLYSTGYMVHHGHHAPRYNRFFAFLGLFSFSMLGLILTDSVFFLFVFWELVGLCSYFLIGFEFERQAACRASIKAFLTTRIGDCGFFIALMIIGMVVGKFTFAEIFASVKGGQWPEWLLITTAILLFIGPVGKSAQFPLHVWLPDAMEGPTPVSALIHAATMVVAGVYLIARMFPFFVGADFFAENMDVFNSIPLTVVAFVGSFTSIYAATIALVQKDFKKVLAYSTVSQLGYMVLAMGVGSISAGCFHLWTHAFFKACLFLGAGSVIHAVETGDMKSMGGLRHKMPITFYTFLISTMAIAGVPLLSGFFSKEAILTQAFMYGEVHGGIYYMPFVFGMITAVLTPFYMFRAVCKAFYGKPRDKARYDHAHEAPWTMWVPLVILATLAVLCAGVWSLREASVVFIFPVVAMLVFFTGPTRKTVGVGVLALALMYFGPSTMNALSTAVSGDSHGAHHVEHVEGPGDSHGEDKGHDSHGHGAHNHPWLDFKTSEWFNNRINTNLYFDQLALLESKDMTQPAHRHGVHQHGCLVNPAMPAAEAEELSHKAHSTVMLLSLICATLGIGFAWLLYIGPLSNEVMSPKGGVLAWYRGVLENLYYMDHLYWFVFVEGTLYIRKGFAWFDRNVIDAFVNYVADSVMTVPETARKIDRDAIGVARGSAFMAGVLIVTMIGAGLGGYVSAEANLTHLNAGPFGQFDIPSNVLCGTVTTLILSIATGVIMTLAGIRRSAATLIACIYALSGFAGTSISHKIHSWALVGPESMSAMLAPFAANPTAATVFSVLLLTFILGLWAGVGIDGTIRFIGEKLTLGLGHVARRIQTGRLQDYLFMTVLLSVVVLVISALL